MRLNHLCELATDGTSDGLGRVDISEEALGVVLDLLDVEAEALVLASGGVDNTGDKAVLGASKAANAATDTLADFSRVGEGEARRASLALDSLVDVGGGDGGRLVVTLEAGEGDVVADDVLLAVDAELVDALGALEAAGVGVVGVDDLVGSCLKLVGRGEREGRLLGDCSRCQYGILIIECFHRRNVDSLPSSLLLPHFSPQSFPTMGVAMVEAAMEAAMARENFMVIDWVCWVGGWKCCWMLELLEGCVMMREKLIDGGRPHIPIYISIPEPCLPTAYTATPVATWPTSRAFDKMSARPPP